AVELGQIELEREAVAGLDLDRWRFLGRRGSLVGRRRGQRLERRERRRLADREQLEIAARRRVGGQSDRQRDVRRGRRGNPRPGELGGGDLDLVLVVQAAAVRGDVLDPVAEVAEHPVGEVEQRRFGGTLLG